MLNGDYLYFRPLVIFAPVGNIFFTLALVSASCCVIGVFTSCHFLSAGGCKYSNASLEREYNLGKATFRILCIIYYLLQFQACEGGEFVSNKF